MVPSDSLASEAQQRADLGISSKSIQNASSCNQGGAMATLSFRHSGQQLPGPELTSALSVAEPSSGVAYSLTAQAAPPQAPASQAYCPSPASTSLLYIAMLL